jgi:hypothetical protein
MQVKKKQTQVEKDYRRLKEAEKAQLRTVVERAVAASENKLNSPVAEKKASPVLDTTKNTKSDRYKLPIKDIKVDLVKNIAYAAFAVALLVALKVTNIGFDQVKGLFHL